MFMVEEIGRIATLEGSNLALCNGSAEMTYEEFYQRIGGLASALTNQDVGPGDRVAIAIGRSFEMIIAIFGTLASGATYVPLDPSNPTSRLTTILEDCKASILLADEDSKHLAGLSGIRPMTTEEWPLQGLIYDREDTTGAYIIYTSGTTGKPKGVEVGNPALLNYVKWAAAELPFTGGGVPLFTSISFDHAITNIFPPLIKGEKIILLPSIQGGRALASALFSKRDLSDEKYSYVKITPSLFGFLDKSQRAELGSRTNLLMFGGEKLSANLISDARRDSPDLAIMNHYGPTETTVGCCVYRVPYGVSNPIVPIGEPIPGVEVSIRREDLSTSGANEIGELFISGVALANGYWGRPEITEKSFLDIADEESGKKRWYRTGDLARRTANGRIELLGRIDDQIKILGNRIEPGEILAVLNKIPNVRQSTVFSTEEDNSTEMVAAVAFTDEPPGAESMREHLQKFLPSVMIPKRYLILDEIPVVASGKADIKALRSMLPAIADGLPIEALVAKQFQEMLGSTDIGSEDDYFSLGGDSIGAVELTMWASRQFKIQLEIWCLYDFPTIKALSNHIRYLTEEYSQGQWTREEPQQPVF